MTDVIESFHGPYAFLSNFYQHHIVWLGLDCPTNEHAYQLSKTKDRRLQRYIATLPSPGAAKRYCSRRASKIVLRPDWEEVKQEVMLALCRLKFADPDLRHRLLDTRTAVLIEGNNWHDNEWGVCMCGRRRECAGVGRNILGQILMRVRGELSAGLRP